MFSRMSLLLSVFTLLFSSLANSGECDKKYQDEFFSSFSNNKCKSVSGDFDCYVKWERKRIGKYAKYIKRENSILFLSLDSGVSISYESNLTDNETYKSYWFLGRYKETGYYVVYASYWESSSYIFISRNGSVFSVDEFPIFSPDSKYFVTSYVGDYENVSSFQVWKISREGKYLEYEINSPVELGQDGFWGLAGVKWVNHRKISANRCVDLSSQDGEVYFEIKNGKWVQIKNVDE